MKEAQKNKWQKTRAKGKRNYIIFNGVIGWGIPTGVLFTLFTSLVNDKSITFDQDFFRTMITSIVLFPIGGIFFGLWTWNWMERLYKKNKPE